MNIIYTIICEWCGYHHHEKWTETERDYFQCPCCSLSEMDCEDNENFELWRGFP